MGGFLGEGMHGHDPRQGHRVLPPDEGGLRIARGFLGRFRFPASLTAFPSVAAEGMQGRRFRILDPWRGRKGAGAGARFVGPAKFAPGADFLFFSPNR
jgi:hypothetical protein